MNITGLVFVGLGGFLGAIARFAISQTFNRNKAFPYGTLIVNLLGSFLLGFLVGFKVADLVYLFLGTGFLGAFTTFSTLKSEMWKMLEAKKVGSFIRYICLTYCLGILLAFFGYSLGNLM